MLPKETVKETNAFFDEIEEEAKKIISTKTRVCAIKIVKTEQQSSIEWAMRYSLWGYDDLRKHAVHVRFDNSHDATHFVWIKGCWEPTSKEGAKKHVIQQLKKS